MLAVNTPAFAATSAPPAPQAFSSAQERFSRSALPVGRFAPSPTGALHLGNAWAFLLAWLAARIEGGRVLLRQEDLDPQRSRRSFMEDIERDLRWLGLDWDEGPDVGGPRAPYVQSACGEYYAAALESLAARGLVYPCFCTRKELRLMAGAPHGAADGLGDAGAAYPGTCRHLSVKEREARLAAGRHASLRLLCPDGEDGRMNFFDLARGPQSFTLTECGGDFALRRSDGVWAYQLAVTVDDWRMGVTQVVRGEDILASTPRQLLLYRLLGYAPPRFAHIPLLYDARGERLAKRHASLSLAALREQGCRPEALTAWLAEKAGLKGMGGVTPRGMVERLRAENLSFPWRLLPKDRVLTPDGIAALWR